MYFKEKENTNIDEEFQGKKKFDIQKYKPLILIVGGVIVLFVIIFINKKYFKEICCNIYRY